MSGVSHVRKPRKADRVGSEYVVSTRSIGDRVALEHRDNESDLKLFGRGGYIMRLSADRYLVVITKEAYKLASSDFSDRMPGDQVLYVSARGISRLADHLGIPTDPQRQLKYSENAREARSNFSPSLSA